MHFNSDSNFNSNSSSDSNSNSSSDSSSGSDSNSGSDSSSSSDSNKGVPLLLRILLWLLNHFVWVNGRPLPRMRLRMQLLMKMFDLIATERALVAITTRDMKLPGNDGYLIPVRIYSPPSHKPLPIVVYYHGGGFALGTHTIRGRFNRALAARTGAVVISVGYRLAPEHPFPQAVEDAYAALCWCASDAATFGGDSGRIAVAGESAGGNLAAAAALMARDRGGPALKCQALLYPAVDLFSSQPSIHENGHGYMLTIELLRQFTAGYTPQQEQRRHPYASPLLAETLKGLPPAVLITAELCPLRDQGRLYAERLAEAGVPVVYTCYEHMIHDFTAMMSGVLPSARQSLQEVTQFVRKELSEGG